MTLGSRLAATGIAVLAAVGLTAPTVAFAFPVPESVQVAPAAVKKKQTAIKLKFNKTSQVYKGTPAKVTITTWPTSARGKVSLYDRGKLIKSLTPKNGKVTYKLPKNLKAGKHKISAKFFPSNTKKLKVSKAKYAWFTVTSPVSAPPPSLTFVQQQAVRVAQDYLEFMGFSRQGLIDQLSSPYGEQYKVKDATIAVDSMNVDWYAQAARVAQEYLDLMGFSCQGMIDQLSSPYGEQFTVKQATYGAQQVGLC